MNNTKAKDRGKKIFQHKRINWSILNLGKLARTQIKKNKINDVLKPKTKGSRIVNKLTGTNNQPPRNIMTVKILIKIIEPYSAKKNKAKPILAYSTLKPLTNSDSASGRSKGARFVSAKIEIKNIKKRGKNGIKKYIQFWYKTISVKFNEPTQIKIDIKINPIETS